MKLTNKIDNICKNYSKKLIYQNYEPSKHIILILQNHFVFILVTDCIRFTIAMLTVFNLL